MLRIIGLSLMVFQATAAPIDADAAPTYSDDVARNIFYPLVAAAYTNPKDCVQNAIDGMVKRQITVHCDAGPNDTCSGYTAFSQKHKAIVVVFRGTTTALQTLNEIAEAFEQRIKFGSGVVHKYFYDGFYQLWMGGMKDDFLQLRAQFPSYEVWVTGHSLGAAMATVAANYISLNYGDHLTKGQVKFITFGEPRVGDKAFADGHDALLPYSFRVVNQNDFAPHVPLQMMGFHHHLSEVWYNNDMSTANYTVCAQQEDKSCSNAHIDVSVVEHFDYFNHNIFEWIKTGCK